MKWRLDDGTIATLPENNHLLEIAQTKTQMETNQEMSDEEKFRTLNASRFKDL